LTLTQKCFVSVHPIHTISPHVRSHTVEINYSIRDWGGVTWLNT